MPQKTLYLCQNCKFEWEAVTTKQPVTCKYCGSSKVYKSHHHQRASKKSRSKERWSFRTK